MKLVEEVNGKTELYALLGNPVEHTKSPFIHNTLFKENNINAIYIPVQANKEDLGKAVNGFRAQNFSGFNVTVPYKKDIIQYLDDISTDALLMGAINTVENQNGRFIGYNTDADGFVRDFCDGFGTTFKGKRVMLLGAGGTARAIAVKLAAEGIEHLVIANRTESNAQNIANLVNNNYGNIVSTINSEPDLLNSEMQNSQVVINTTPAGMSTYLDSTPFDFDFKFSCSQLVYDVIYVPKKTKFLKQAEKAGCKLRNGFGMLINQGISSFEIWTGTQVSKTQADELLKKIENLEEF
ncbi:MAG TPA: shikimate dehydrogenase [Ruminiclostridium sp.]|nr:shikimate dehydrogenase [Ruminiclostridium sp.]